MGVTRTVKVAGSGRTPQRGEKITVHCTGYLYTDGGRKKFWSSRDDDKPFSFVVGVGQVIKGWDEGILQMQQGETAELHMTSDYGYGERGFPAWGITPNAPLIFDIELLKIN